VVIVDIIISIGDFKAVSVGECERFGHPLFASKLPNTGYSIMWQWEFGPKVLENAATSAERHKIMAALFIAGRAEANSASSAGLHPIRVFLVGLHIAAEFEVNVLSIVQMFPGKKIAWQKIVGDTIRVRESVKPKNGITYESNEHEPGDTLEGERIISTVDAVLDSANKPFNLRDVFILCTQVEWNLWEVLLERSKFRVCKYGRNPKAASVI
jgi:hypothetical protein